MVVFSSPCWALCLPGRWLLLVWNTVSSIFSIFSIFLFLPFFFLYSQLLESLSNLPLVAPSLTKTFVQYPDVEIRVYVRLASVVHQIFIFGITFYNFISITINTPHWPSSPSQRNTGIHWYYVNSTCNCPVMLVTASRPRLLIIKMSKVLIPHLIFF